MSLDLIYSTAIHLIVTLCMKASDGILQKHNSIAIFEKIAEAALLSELRGEWGHFLQKYSQGTP